jgi:protein transport protein SEC61 subunit gamma-like protein
MLYKVKSFLAKCVRVWHVLRKPNSREFKMVAKVSALGVLLIGLMGFIIAMIMNLFK